VCDSERRQGHEGQDKTGGAETLTSGEKEEERNQKRQAFPLLRMLQAWKGEKGHGQINTETREQEERVQVDASRDTSGEFLGDNLWQQ